MAEVATGSSGRGPAIVFTGFMAAGKSTAARAVAERLGVEAHDSDTRVEQESGMRVADIFEREGEAGFREREERAVLALLDSDAEVIALGGGSLGSERVRDALEEHLVVLCGVSEDLAWKRASRGGRRPLAGDRDGFAALFAEREGAYRAAARVVLPGDVPGAAALAAPWLDALRGAPALRMAWASSASGSYPAVVGRGAIDVLERAREAGAAGVPARSFAIVDEAAAGHHRGLLGPLEAEIGVPGAESSKTLAEAQRVLGELASAGARRDDLVLAFGGGVVGDLAGFCAATYQRGVPVVQAPTTLVSQVDSAYGGKTGVDLPEAKNYVGAYHMPLAVLADPATLATLPAPELSAGFAEVVKTALIAGGPLWERVRSIDSLDPAGLDDVVFDCAQVKIEVVASDERDSGRRAVLNLGHTVGHAIETVTGYGRYRHGEAVGLGLLAALRLSEADELRSEVQGLLAANGLPTFLDASIDPDAVVAATARDKKASAAGVGFVLLAEPGEPRWGESVEPDRVRASVAELQRDGA